MGTVTRGVAGLLFVLFVGGLVLRPLVANPTVSAALSDGPASPEVLFVTPLVVLGVLVVVLRLRWDGDSGGDTFQGRSEAGQEREGSWGIEDGEWGADEDASDLEMGAVTDESGHPTGPDLLGGQGGTRERGFEMEENPPEARLSDHLEHLREELDGETAARADLETLATVAETAEPEHPVPERCPGPHCGAVWTGRTVLGFNRGRYERLEDGRVQCLECERIHRLE